MTKKNSKKRAARALQQKHGGSYQHHLRSVGGAEGDGATPRSSIAELPHFRHVYLRHPIDFEIDVFTVNQSASWFVAKFDTGWSNTVHRLEPVYHRASWAQDAPATERELRELARRAIEHVDKAGFVLVVHAPGKLAMMWSDHELPREGLSSTFGPSLRAVPYQPIEDGPPPPWWPAHEVTRTSEEEAESEGLLDPASHPVFMLNQLYEAAEDILHEHPEGPAFLATVLAYTLPDRSTPFVPMVPATAMKFMHDAPRWYFDGWLAFVDGELYEGDRPVKEDMLSTVAGRTRLADILVQQIKAEAPWLKTRLKSFEVKRGYAYANNLRVEVALSFVDEQVETFINLLQDLENAHAKVMTEGAKGATSLTWSTAAQRTTIDEARQVLAKLETAAVTKSQKELVRNARSRFERTWTRWEGSLTRVEGIGAVRR